MIPHQQAFYVYYFYGPYLLSVCSDPSSLQPMALDFRYPEAQMARCVQGLGLHDFEIIHRKGYMHEKEEVISRRVCNEAPCR